MKRQLSQQAQVAKLCKTICRDMGLKATASSSSYSMGDSVRVGIVDASPSVLADLEKRTNKFQYGSFDGMEDIYNNDNVDGSIPQTKFLFIENKMSDSIKQEAWLYIKKNVSSEEIAGLPDDYKDVMNVYIDYFCDNAATIVSRCLRSERSFIGDFWGERQSVAVATDKKATVSSDAALFSEISEHTHTKKQTVMFITSLTREMSRADFVALRELAREFGGWYSRKWGDTPCGFAFGTQEQAQQFIDRANELFAGGSPAPLDPNGAKKGSAALKIVPNKLPAKFRAMADYSI